MTKHFRFFAMGLLFTINTVTSNAQTSRDIMVRGGLDLIKSDITGVAEKVQLGFEADYFINRNFSVSGGFEIWSAGNNFFMLGLRWYPASNLFARFRGLISDDPDFGIGLGYAHALSSNWRLEGIADYYLVEGELGLRLGIGHVFR